MKLKISKRDLLLELLGSKDLSVRTAVVRAIGRLGNDSQVEKLLPILAMEVKEGEEEKIELIEAAVEAIRMIGNVEHLLPFYFCTITGTTDLNMLSEIGKKSYHLVDNTHIYRFSLILFRIIETAASSPIPGANRAKRKGKTFRIRIFSIRWYLFRRNKMQGYSNYWKAWQYR